MSKKFCGNLVAIATPMSGAGSIDYPSLAALIDWHIDEGSDGIVIAGTTGESPTLAMQEHQALIARTVEMVGGRVPVVAGVGANNTAEAVELAKQAQADGADAGLSVVPYYNKPMQEGLYRHFAAVAEATPLPLILYDVPGRCVVRLENSTVARLAALPSIVGIKDAVGEVARAARLAQAAGGDSFTLLSGDDSTCCEYILAGGDGVISVTANIAPGNMSRMVAAARSGDAQAARRLDAKMQAFHKMQGVESNPIPVKAALAMMGRIAPAIRLPLTPLSEQHRAPVREAMEAAQESGA